MQSTTNWIIQGVAETWLNENVGDRKISLEDFNI